MPPKKKSGKKKSGKKKKGKKSGASKEPKLTVEEAIVAFQWVFLFMEEIAFYFTGISCRMLIVQFQWWYSQNITSSEINRFILWTNRLLSTAKQRAIKPLNL